MAPFKYQEVSNGHGSHSDLGSEAEIGSNLMEEDEFHEHHAQIAPRKCQDAPCYLLFLACLGVMGYIGWWSWTNGDIRRLSHGFEFQGKLCGVDQGLEGLPYVYYCVSRNDNSKLALDFPICVMTCPSTSDQDIDCPEYSGGAVSPLPTKTYPSSHVGVKVCLPESPLLKQQILGNNTVFGKFEKLTDAADSIEIAWPMILGIFAGLLIFGFIFLKSLQLCAGTLIQLTLVAILGGSIALGSYYVYRSQKLLENIEEGQVINHEREAMGGSRELELYIGVGLLTFGVLYFIIGCCCCKTVLPVAIAVVEQACEVIFEMPAMLLQPFTEALLKLAVFVLFLGGEFLLLSSGEITPEDAVVGNFNVRGMHKKFEMTDKQMAFMAVWACCSLWVHETVVAIGLFTSTYSTVIWFYTPIHHTSAGPDKDIPLSLFPLVKGATYGCTKNLGSLAFGGLLCFLCRGLQLTFGLIAWVGHQHNSIARICLCCLTCFTRFFEHLNKNAYVEIAINSTSFCVSAKKAWSAVVTNGGKFAVLHGAATFLKWIGIFTITLVGTAAAHCLVKLQVYDNPQSDSYLESPYAVVGAVLVLSLTVGMAFMTLFDQVADVLLYCFVEATKRGEAQIFAPPSMVQLLNDDHNTACC